MESRGGSVESGNLKSGSKQLRSGGLGSGMWREDGAYKRGEVISAGVCFMCKCLREGGGGVWVAWCGRRPVISACNICDLCHL